MQLELATESDVPRLLRMMEPFNELEQIAWNGAAMERGLRALLADRALGLVALLEDQGSTVGYFVLTWGYDLEWNGRDAVLTELYLVPDARGKGLGKIAMSLAESLARDQGAHALHLMVRTENAVARGLYARQGFVSPDRIFLSKSLGA